MATVSYYLNLNLPIIEESTITLVIVEKEVKRWGITYSLLFFDKDNNEYNREKLALADLLEAEVMSEFTRAELREILTSEFLG